MKLNQEEVNALINKNVNLLMRNIKKHKTEKESIFVNRKFRKKGVFIIPRKIQLINISNIPTDNIDELFEESEIFDNVNNALFMWLKGWFFLQPNMPWEIWKCTINSHIMGKIYALEYKINFL